MWKIIHDELSCPSSGKAIYMLNKVLEIIHKHHDFRLSISYGGESGVALKFIPVFQMREDSILCIVYYDNVAGENYYINFALFQPHQITL